MPNYTHEYQEAMRVLIDLTLDSDSYITILRDTVDEYSPYAPARIDQVLSQVEKGLAERIAQIQRISITLSPLIDKEELNG